MSGTTSPIARYYQGARPQDFTPAEALSVAEEIQHWLQIDMPWQPRKFARLTPQGACLQIAQQRRKRMGIPP